MSVDDIANAIFDMVPNPGSPFFFAKFVSTDPADANLSVIEVPYTNGLTGTNQIRYVPKINSTGTPSTGQTVLCSSNPFIIIGVVVGDISKPL